MIKFSKMFFTNPAKIWISNIKCSFNNVVKIIKVFNCEWMTMTTDSIAEGSALLTFVKKHNLEYAERHLSNCNIELSVLLPHTLLKEFLEKAFNEEPENIFIYNSFHMNCNMACTRHSLEELTATGATDACISIALDEDAILICMNKSRYSSKDVFQAIKSLHFEQNSLGSFQPHT